jgi:hypothetical protein
MNIVNLDNIPTNPQKVYIKSWISWGYWLGNDNVSTAKREFLKYEDAERFVQSLKIKTISDWVSYCSSDKKPKNIPSNPNYTYSKNKLGGWKSWAYWLDTDRHRDFLPYDEAKLLIRDMKLKRKKSGETIRKIIHCLRVYLKIRKVYIEKSGWVWEIG